MNAEDILSTIGDALSYAGDFLKQFGVWLWGVLQSFCTWAALSVSSWFSSLTLPMMPTILKIFSNASVNLAVFYIVFGYIIIINIAAFVMFGNDKKKAAGKRTRRTPEKSLLKVCFWGGAAGGLIGMQIFRHKTLHKKFTVLVPIMFVIQLILDSFILGFLAFWAFF